MSTQERINLFHSVASDELALLRENTDVIGTERVNHYACLIIERMIHQTTVSGLSANDIRERLNHSEPKAEQKPLNQPKVVTAAPGYVTVGDVLRANFKESLPVATVAKLVADSWRQAKGEDPLVLRHALGKDAPKTSGNTYIYPLEYIPTIITLAQNYLHRA